MWQHIQGYMDQQMHEIMEGLYRKLNTELFKCFDASFGINTIHSSAFVGF
jgi:hypothetical protein